MGKPWIDALKANAAAIFAKLKFLRSPSLGRSHQKISDQHLLGIMCVGVAPSIADLAAFKHLLFENQALMMHSFKATAREDDAAQKKLSAPEREARLDFQSSDSDAWISQPLEPAQALYDSCASMVDKNEIAYIGPGKYLSRQHELM